MPKKPFWGLLGLVTLWAQISIVWAQPADSEAEKQRLIELRQAIQQTQDALANTQVRSSTVRSQIQLLQEQNQAATELYQLLETRQNRLELDIRQVQTALGGIQKKVNQRQRDLEQRLKRLYLLGIRPGMNWDHPLLKAQRQPVLEVFRQETHRLREDRLLLQQRTELQNKLNHRMAEFQKQAFEQTKLMALLGKRHLEQEQALDSLAIAENTLRRELARQEAAEAALEAEVRTLDARRIAYERQLKARRDAARKEQARLARLNQQKPPTPGLPPKKGSTSKTPAPERLEERDGTARCAPLRGTVYSKYGRQIHPTLKTETFRKGTEIKAAAGTSIRAARDGQVVHLGELAGVGPSLILMHEGGYLSVYGHLQSPRVRVGQEVLACDILGTVAPYPAPARLYFQLYQGREHRDPAAWLKGSP
jgi:septal ring factor EnvC (AmiA/AmiB activator)